MVQVNARIRQTILVLLTCSHARGTIEPVGSRSPMRQEANPARSRPSFHARSLFFLGFLDGAAARNHPVQEMPRPPSIPEDLAQIWREHRRWLAVVLLAHRPRGVELEDLLQDVALTLVRRHGDLQDPARIRPWLRAIAVNHAREAGRRRLGRPRFADPQGLEQLVEIDRSLERLELAEETRAVLDRALELPEELREPLLLRSLRGLSQKEIAATLELNETTVESRIARARRLLRERTNPRAALPPARVIGDHRHADS